MAKQLKLYLIKNNLKNKTANININNKNYITSGHFVLFSGATGGDGA